MPSVGRCRYCGYGPVAHDARFCPQCASLNPRPSPFSTGCEYGLKIGVFLGLCAGLVWGLYVTGGVFGAVMGPFVGALAGCLLGLLGGMICGSLATVATATGLVPGSAALQAGPKQLARCRHCQRAPIPQGIRYCPICSGENPSPSAFYRAFIGGMKWGVVLCVPAGVCWGLWEHGYGGIFGGLLIGAFAGLLYGLMGGIGWGLYASFAKQTPALQLPPPTAYALARPPEDTIRPAGNRPGD